MFKEVLAEWKRNVAPPIWSAKKQKYVPNTRWPLWQKLCTYKRIFVRGQMRTNFDLHYVNPVLSDGGTADVAFYVLKYMMKPSDRAVRLQQALHLNLPEDEYDSIWKLVKCRHFESEGFGLGADPKRSSSLAVYRHIRKSVELGKHNSDFPVFFNPVDGKSFPLARYYKNRPELYSIDDALDFFYNDRDSRADNMIIRPDIGNGQYEVSLSKFAKSEKVVDFQQTATDFDDLYDSEPDDFILDFD